MDIGAHAPILYAPRGGEYNPKRDLINFTLGLIYTKFIDD